MISPCKDKPSPTKSPCERTSPVFEDTEEHPLERERPSNDGRLERRGWGERGTGLGSCRGEEVKEERWMSFAGWEMGEGSGEG